MIPHHDYDGEIQISHGEELFFFKFLFCDFYMFFVEIKSDS